jgi:hypothetical protein
MGLASDTSMEPAFSVTGGIIRQNRLIRNIDSLCPAPLIRNS